MNYWRMQLHPASSGDAAAHTIKCLTAGYIGLDFDSEVGDLQKADKGSLPSKQKDYWAFAHEMVEGDWVLIIVHHFPFALAKVSGPYNYIRPTEPKIPVWFRHFRAIDQISYYSDFKTNAHQWEKFTMTDTISPLRDPGSLSYGLIQEWLRSEKFETA